MDKVRKNGNARATLTLKTIEEKNYTIDERWMRSTGERRNR
jgi:hypothetical protein